jgi:hypothetical protein
VAAALEWIPTDLHYDDWIDIGLAIRSAIGDAGFPLWVEWSRKSERHGLSGATDTPERRWKTFNPDRIGAGTIYRHAMDHGWSPPPGMQLNGAEVDRLNADLIHGNPAAGLIAKAQANGANGANGHAEPEPPAGLAPSGPATPADVAKIVAAAPGLLGETVRWMTATAISPQPFLSLGAALCAIGTIAGHRYRLDTPDTRSNIFVIAIADSGAGKDHPRRCVRRVFAEAGLIEHLGGEQIKSGSGLMAAVTEQPRLLYQIDEFGHFIKAVLDRKNAGHHLKEIMTNFTTLWSSATERVRGADYANRVDRPRRDIIEPCVCLYGSTVPQAFWGALQSGNVGDGSLARFLVFLSPENYPDECDPVHIETGMDEIVQKFAQIAVGAPQEGNLVQAGVVAPRVVPLDGGASQADRALREEHLAMKRAHEGTAYSAIIARFREHIRHVALIAAVADNPHAPVCTAEHMAWSTLLVRHCQATVVDQSDRFIADSDYEAQQKQVLEAVKASGGWMPLSDIAKSVRSIKARDRNDILNHLAEAGFIEMQRQASTGGRPSVLVRALESSGFFNRLQFLGDPYRLGDLILDCAPCVQQYPAVPARFQDSSASVHKLQRIGERADVPRRLHGGGGAHRCSPGMVINNPPASRVTE